MAESVIYVELKARLMQQLNHVVAAILLLSSGVGALREHRHIEWALLEIGVALVLVVLIARSRIQRAGGLHEHVPHHVGWLEIASGVMVAVEKTSMLRERPHHLSFVITSYIPPVILVLMGILEPAVKRRFFVRADDDRIEWRFSRWNHKAVAWSDIASASIGKRAISLVRVDGGKTRIPTWRVDQTSLVNEWIDQQLRLREIATAQSADTGEEEELEEAAAD